MVKEVVSRSEFKLDEDEVSNFAARIFFNYRATAMSLGVDILTYAQRNCLGDTEDALLLKCYQEAEYKIGRLLTLDRIAQIEGLEATNEEITQYCEELGGNAEALSDEEYAEIKVSVSQMKAENFLYQAAE